jgi:four helix bundle protein
MAKYQRFEDLPAWQEAARLYNCVLDLLDTPRTPLSSGFRNQLERAALSVSNNIAEGFERATTAELVAFLAIAKGSSGEVRSMIATVKTRPSLRTIKSNLEVIATVALSCSRQLMAWIRSIDDGSINGKRHLDARAKESQRVAKAAQDFRTRFLRDLQPDHPLYKTEAARQARGDEHP